MRFQNQLDPSERFNFRILICDFDSALFGSGGPHLTHIKGNPPPKSISIIQKIKIKNQDSPARGISISYFSILICTPAFHFMIFDFRFPGCRIQFWNPALFLWVCFPICTLSFLIFDLWFSFLQNPGFQLGFPALSFLISRKNINSHTSILFWFLNFECVSRINPSPASALISDFNFRFLFVQFSGLMAPPW